MDTLFLDEIAATPTWHGSRAAIYKKPDGNLYFKDGPSGTETGLSGTAAISSAGPVGSIYIAAVSTDPATLMGFGTWARFGTGKVLVSQLDGDADFKMPVVAALTITYSPISSFTCGNELRKG